MASRPDSCILSTVILFQNYFRVAVASVIVGYSVLGGLSLNPVWGDCVFFLGKTLYSTSALFHPYVC